MVEPTLEQRRDRLQRDLQRKIETAMLIEARLSGEKASIAHMTTQLQGIVSEMTPVKSELESVEKQIAAKLQKEADEEAASNAV